MGNRNRSLQTNISKKAFKRLANSVALAQAAPELKKIYQSYYIGCEKDFIELLDVISENGLDKVENAIDKLESICQGDINTDKIKMIVQRNDTKISRPPKNGDQIEVYSKQILESYSSLLSLSVSKEANLL